MTINLEQYWFMVEYDSEYIHRGYEYEILKIFQANRKEEITNYLFNEKEGQTFLIRSLFDDNFVNKLELTPFLKHQIKCVEVDTDTFIYKHKISRKFNKANQNIESNESNENNQSKKNNKSNQSEKNNESDGSNESEENNKSNGNNKNSKSDGNNEIEKYEINLTEEEVSKMVIDEYRENPKMFWKDLKRSRKSESLNVILILNAKKHKYWLETLYNTRGLKYLIAKEQIQDVRYNSLLEISLKEARKMIIKAEDPLVELTKLPNDLICKLLR